VYRKPLRLYFLRGETATALSCTPRRGAAHCILSSQRAAGRAPL